MQIKSLIFLLLFYLCGSAFGSIPNRDTPQAKNGIIDLRKQDLSNIIPLNGEWKFYWKQLLNPGQAPIEKGMLAKFPSQWKDLQINGKKLPFFGYATYKLTILLPSTYIRWSGVSFKINMRNYATAFYFPYIR